MHSGRLRMKKKIIILSLVAKVAENDPKALKTKPSIRYKNIWLQLLTCSCKASELLNLKLPIKREFVLMRKK